MNRVFWSIIEARGVKAGPIPDGLWPLLEDDLPVSAEQVFAVGAPLDQDRLLVCAALKDEITAAAGTSESLTPDEIPEWVGIRIDPARFNMLVGSFEPRAKRVARQHRRLRAAAAVLIAAIFVAVGLERRARAWNTETDRCNAAALPTLAPISTSLGWGRDDLAMELKQRRESAPLTVKVPPDASLVIASILGRWPIQVPAKAQAMLAAGDSASVSVLVLGDPATFIAALKPPDGWKIEEPRIVSVDKSTRITLELRRAAP